MGGEGEGVEGGGAEGGGGGGERVAVEEEEAAAGRLSLHASAGGPLRKVDISHAFYFTTNQIFESFVLRLRVFQSNELVDDVGSSGSLQGVSVLMLASDEEEGEEFGEEVGCGCIWPLLVILGEAIKSFLV